MLEDGYYALPPGKLAMVVTHLEMHAPASLRGAALPEGLTFAPGPRDVPAYRDLIRLVGKDWLWFARLEMPDDELSAILESPDVDLYTLLHKGIPSAILELDFREDRACELAYYGVAPDLIGSGAGSFLMDRAIETAWARDIDRFHLHTCTLDSPQALGFYIRSGFTPNKREFEIADDPRLTGLLPRNAAPHVPLI